MTEQPMETLPWRIVDKIMFEPNTGCWLWTRDYSASGYGRVRPTVTDSTKGPAHRIVYEHFVGPIPSGLELDHLCRMRRCVSPYHMEPVTRKVNLHRGVDMIWQLRRQATHCVHGHGFTKPNTIVRLVNGSVTRSCRICHNIVCKMTYARRKERSREQQQQP